jgi:hypothetical protein
MHQRVRRTNLDGRGRLAIVTGAERMESGIPVIDVIPEGCTDGRPRTWRLTDFEPLPQEKQLESLGGSFKPPKGYPMIPSDDAK